MYPAHTGSKLFCFGPFELDPHTRELRKRGVCLRLPEQSCRVLVALVERPGELVTREELHRQLWTNDTFVDFDHGLNLAVARVRQVLGDTADQPRYVETLPRRGYRFLGKVEIRCDSEGPAVPANAQPQAAAIETIQNRSKPAAAVAPPKSHSPLATAGVMLVVVSLATVAFWYPRSRAPESPSQSWNIRPVTRFAGSESGPSLSPDGRFVAFHSTYGGAFNIFVMPLAGGNAVQLTNGAADAFVPRWSPDGRYIAFLSDAGRTKLVYLIPPSGGEPYLLTDTKVPFLERFAQTYRLLGSRPWSPDGRELVFSRLDDTGRISIWKINLETRQEIRLTSPPAECDDLDAAWSFDRRSIAFSRVEHGLGSLWRLDLSSEAARPVLRDGSDNTVPAWSVDNSRLVFQSNRQGADNLWEIELASGHLRKITNGGGSDVTPVIGPKGLLYSQRAYNANLWSLTVPTGFHKQLTHNTGRSYWPRMSSDGRWLVYHSDRTHLWDLWLLDLETGSERQLTRDAAIDLTPEWAPDGRHVSFISNRDGPFHIWLMDLERGTARRLIDQPVHAPPTITNGAGQVAPVHAWSPDGRKIGFIAETAAGPTLWVADADGRNAQPIVSGALGFDWYRDAEHLLYTRLRPDGSWTRELVARDIGTGSEQVLYRGPHLDIAAAKDGSAVLFCYAPSHPTQSLFMLPLAQAAGAMLPHAAGEPKRLTDGKGLWHAHHGSWSRDGKSVFYSRDALEGDIYMIENYR